MKKVLLVLGLGLVSTLSYGQSRENEVNLKSDSIPCNITIKIDSYSGKKTIETGFVGFSGGTYLLTKEKGVINFWIQLESSIHLTINSGEIFYIKFTDNTIMKLVITSTDYGDYSSYRDSYTNSFSFNLTGSKLELLKTKKISGIKCYIKEYNFSDNTSEIFKNNINCIVKTK